MTEKITVTCPECGQLLNAAVSPELVGNEKTEAEAALAVCQCPAARKFRAIKRQISEAQCNIRQLCGEASQRYGLEPMEDDEIYSVLDEIIELAGGGKILDAAVKLSGLGTIKIKKGAKEQIKVSRTLGITETLEANLK